MDGVLVLDKPAGLSSAAAVDRVKRALGAARAGHAGTLDPIATGVLPICLGAATRLAEYLLADDKAYEAEGTLGIETDTLDRTGRVVAERAVEVEEGQLRAALARRLGEQDQVPPAFSAIKQDGVRNYHRARAGETVQLAPRRICIDSLELIAFEPPRFRIAVACSKGTYIRSLIADLGADVGCGAHLSELRRTRCGRFRIEGSLALDRLGELDPARHLVSLIAATGLPEIVLRAELVGPVRSGLQLQAEALPCENLERFQLIDESGRLIAIAHAAAGRVVYDRVFSNPVEAKEAREAYAALTRGEAAEVRSEAPSGAALPSEAPSPEAPSPETPSSDTPSPEAPSSDTPDAAPDGPPDSESDAPDDDGQAPRRA